jgi:TRIAD3 protein (E3 ubiquitin-protein ligase RNF216)
MLCSQSQCSKCGSQGVLPKTETTFSCPLASCRHQSCRICSEPAHEPIACSDVEKQKVTGARLSIEESMTDAYVRKCPSCNYAFVRDSGCNKMTCRHCHALSCYICRRLIQDVHHFDNGVCPLFSSDDLTDRENVRTAGTNAEERAKRDLGTSELEGLAQRYL